RRTNAAPAFPQGGRDNPFHSAQLLGTSTHISLLRSRRSSTVLSAPDGCLACAGQGACGGDRTLSTGTRFEGDRLFVAVLCGAGTPSSRTLAPLAHRVPSPPSTPRE